MKNITLKEHCQKIAKKGGTTTYKKYGSDYMATLAEKSAAVRRKKKRKLGQTW